MCVCGQSTEPRSLLPGEVNFGNPATHACLVPVPRQLWPALKFRLRCIQYYIFVRCSTTNLWSIMYFVCACIPGKLSLCERNCERTANHFHTTGTYSLLCLHYKQWHTHRYSVYYGIISIEIVSILLTHSNVVINITFLFMFRKIWDVSFCVNSDRFEDIIMTELGAQPRHLGMQRQSCFLTC